MMFAANGNMFINHILKEFGINGNTARRAELHLVADFLSSLHGHRFICRLQSAMPVFVGANAQAHTKGAVTPVSDTSSVKYALFLHARRRGLAQMSSKINHAM